MSGLRERKKERRRALALEAAEKLFRKKGYTETTIEEIATKAELSIGTLYSYFNSKGGIMLELVQPVMETMRARALQVIETPPESATAAIIAMYDAFEFDGDWKSLNLLQALGPDFTASDAQLQQISDDFKDEIEAQFAALLSGLKADKKLRADLQIDDAVFLLYQHMYVHFVDHINSGGAISYEQTLVNMHRRLRLMLDNWSSP